MTDTTDDAVSLDLHLRRKDGRWELECRALDLSYTGDTLAQAARECLAFARDSAGVLYSATPHLRVSGKLRLARLRVLMDVLSALTSKEAT